MNELVPYQLTMEHGTYDPVFESRHFKKQVHDRLVRFIQKYKQGTEGEENSKIERVVEGSDTVVLPVIQMGPFGIRQDEKTTLRLLEIAHENKDWTIDLTSGYFNFTDRYKAFMLRTQARFRFLTASPEVYIAILKKKIRFYLERDAHKGTERQGDQDRI